MMTKYALMYSRLNIETRKSETVVAHYNEQYPRAVHHFEYIYTPLREAEQAMIEQGWKYASAAGPQSILMQHA